GHRRNRPRLYDEEERPTEEESDGRAVSLAKEDVLPARARPYRRKLRAAQSARYRQHARQSPRRQKPTRRADQSRTFSRRDENPRPDHRADDDHRRVEQTEAPLKVLLRIVRDFSRRRRRFCRHRRFSPSVEDKGGASLYARARAVKARART